MATSAEQITDLIASNQALLAYFQAYRDVLDDAVDQAQNDLVQVVQQQMLFPATLNGQEASPTNVRGGTFSDFQTLIDATSQGATLRISLPAGTTTTISGGVNIGNRKIRFIKEGSGDNPILRAIGELEGGLNAIRAITHEAGAKVALVDVDLRLPTAKADAGLAWSERSSFFSYTPGVPVEISMENGRVSGGMSGETLSIATCYGGSLVKLGLFGTTLDGDLYGVTDVENGAAVIHAQNVTLANNALLQVGGTLGTDLLQSAAA